MRAYACIWAWSRRTKTECAWPRIDQKSLTARPSVPLPIRVAMCIFAIVRYQIAFSSAAGPAMTALACRCWSGSPIPTDGNDAEHSLLPLLLQRLSAEQRRLLWHRYLRELPLNPRQIQKVMGLEPEEQQRLEVEALKLLRQAAREHGTL